jgi:hypothetical protein
MATNPPNQSDSCARCGKADAPLRCSRCKAARYCDARCQTAHWPDHKPGCAAPEPAPAPTARAPSTTVPDLPRLAPCDRGRECAVCGADARFVCSRCIKLYFCGVACQRKLHAFHSKRCYRVDAAVLVDPDNRAYMEAFELNLFQEYQAIGYYIESGDKRPFQKARHLVYGAIIAMVLYDPKCGDSRGDPTTPEAERIVDQYKADLKEAGRILYESEGDEGMHDGLLWSFIPRRFHGDINCMWDGIGAWRW